MVLAPKALTKNLIRDGTKDRFTLIKYSLFRFSSRLQTFGTAKLFRLSSRRKFPEPGLFPFRAQSWISLDQSVAFTQLFRRNRTDQTKRQTDEMMTVLLEPVPRINRSADRNGLLNKISG